MKCLILAGGKGERLWPLSRSNFPKQFIKVQKNHSIFQETIARNMAYCDEFIIVTNYAYRSIIANQMEAFQGVPYRCVFEEEGRSTTAAIVLSCFGLQPSEFVFVVSSDHLIDTGECDGLSYKYSILKAKEYARDGSIVLFGARAEEVNSQFGYFTTNGKIFIEKPERKQIKELQGQTIYQNLGMLLFQNGTLQNELKALHPDIYDQCKAAEWTQIPEGFLFKAETIRTIEAVSIEHSVIEKTEKRYGLEIGFGWSDIGSLEDLCKTELSNEGVSVVNDGEGSSIINCSTHRAVVVNDLDNVLVVNTTDAVYIGRKGKSHLLKEILHDNPELDPFTEQGRMFYRPWGYYEQLIEEEGYRVRKVVLLPGKTIYEHRHDQRTENWTVVRGEAKVTLNGESLTYGQNGFISVTPGTAHQISNIGEQPVLFIETAIGPVLFGGDMKSEDKPDVTEAELGLKPDPIIKLSPAFKDYLWGGTKLRDVFGKQCDFDTIAESWELSAHPAGNCMVASGRHKGLSFSKYLETVGKEVLGWKCAPSQSFPLLIKFIDAKQNLSVQVHPNDDYALENESEYGKNEMWYVINAEPGAGLYVGFNRQVSSEEVVQRVADNTILDILNFYPTKPGDVFFIPAGTVHAIGNGNLICEIQQSSNSTYRLYDYGRVDKFGNPRELHLKKALDVLEYGKYEPVDFEIEQDIKTKQIRCKYFETSIVEGDARIQLKDDSFYSITCINGKGTIQLDRHEMDADAGKTFFIPAAKHVLNINGNLMVLITRV